MASEYFKVLLGNSLFPQYLRQIIKGSVLSGFSALWQSSWGCYFFKILLKKCCAGMGKRWVEVERRWFTRLAQITTKEPSPLITVVENLILINLLILPVWNGFWVLLLLVLILRLISAWPTPPLTFGWLALVMMMIVSSMMTQGGTGFTGLGEFLVRISCSWLIGITFTPAFSKRLIKALMLFALVWLTIGLAQYLSGVPTPPGWVDQEQAGLIQSRIFSVFGNPNNYGLFLTVLIPFLLAVSRDSNKPWPKVFYGMLLVLVLISLYLTYSRIAWAIGACYLIWRAGASKSKKIRLYLIAGFLIILALPAFRARIASVVSFSDSSIQYRLQIWQTLLRALQDYWLWGAGPGGFAELFPYYQNYLKLKGTIQHGHQFFLQFWFEYGLFSLVAFIYLVANLLSGIKSYGVYPRAAAAGVLFFLLFGLSETWYLSSFSASLFWVLLGLLVSLKMEDYPTDEWIRHLRPLRSRKSW